MGRSLSMMCASARSFMAVDAVLRAARPAATAAKPASWIGRVASHALIGMNAGGPSEGPRSSTCAPPAGTASTCGVSHAVEPGVAPLDSLVLLGGMAQAQVRLALALTALARGWRLATLD